MVSASFEKSFILEIFEKQMEEHIYNSPIAIQKFLKEKLNFKKISERNNIDLYYHNLKDNTNNADEIGCGCDLCKARYMFVKAKRAYRSFKKSYEDDDCYHYFQAIYAREVNEGNISENEFYSIRSTELFNAFKNKHLIFKDIFKDLEPILSNTP